MKFSQPLVRGKLIRRYFRFLADVELEDGSRVTAHCTNSGSMKSCLEPDAEVCLTPVDNPKRKTRFTWEMIRIGDGWVGVNTSNPNTLAQEWVTGNKIKGLEGMHGVRREVKWEDSRFDLYGEGPLGPCYMEVKNVTLKEGDRALFPDAVTERGLKHLNTLMRVKKAGMRAVMLYVVQRTDVELFSPAWKIDPAYAKAMVRAQGKGVELFALQARVSPGEIRLHRELPVELGRP